MRYRVVGDEKAGAGNNVASDTPAPDTGNTPAPSTTRAGPHRAHATPRCNVTALAFKRSV